MKLYTKVIGLVAGLAGALVLVSGLAVYQAKTSQASNDTVYKSETLATAYLADANSSLWAMRWGVAQYLALTDPAQKQKLIENDQKNYASFDQHISNLSKLPLPDGIRTSLADVNDNYKKYAEARKAWFDLMGQGKTEEAVAFRAKTLTPAGGATVGAIGKLIEALNKQSLAYTEERNANLESYTRWLIGGSVLVLLLCLGGTWMLVANLEKRIRAARSVAQDMAELNLHKLDADTHQDEISEIIGDLDTMRVKLIDVVRHVRRSSDVVASASSEIAHGNHDLSSRTEQQASALEKTASAMDHLNSAVSQNAESARQANQLAHQASNVAVQGGEVVGQVVSTMKDINDSSHKIAEIISVIDGIAFQTNILALNAAVEAARAGDQGRGFAVVASEVRSLAGRSAEAAKEIKNLINASVERVEAGTHLVDKAGETMTEVVTSIRRVTDIMGEISSASEEQASGVSEVGSAIAQIDQATQQNSALVEEMAAAAGGLKHQSSDLVASIAVFKLEGGQQEVGYTQAEDRRPSAPLPVLQKTVAPRPVPKPAAAPKKAAVPKLSEPKAAPKQPVTADSADDSWETF